MIHRVASSSSLISSLLHSHVNLEWCDKIKLSNLLLPRKSGTIKSLQLLSTSATLLELEQPGSRALGPLDVRTITVERHLARRRRGVRLVPVEPFMPLEPFMGLQPFIMEFPVARGERAPLSPRHVPLERNEDSAEGFEPDK